MARSLISDWRIGVPAALWTWGPRFTLLAFVIMTWETGDAEVITLESMASVPGMIVNSAFVVVFGLCFVGRRAHRAAAVGALGSGALAIGHAKVGFGWGVVAVWLVILAWDALASHRQKIVAAGVGRGASPIDSSQIDLTRAALPGSFGRAGAGICLCVVIAGGLTWSHIHDEFRALADRAQSVQGEVKARNGDFTDIDVQTKTYAFSDFSYRATEPGQLVQVWIDPLGKRRPWGPENADPERFSLAVAATVLGAGGLVLSATRFLGRRRCIKRVLSGMSAVIVAEVGEGSDASQVNVRVMPDGFVVGALKDIRLIYGDDDVEALSAKRAVRIFGLQNYGAPVLVEALDEDGSQALFTARMLHPWDFDPFQRDGQDKGSGQLVLDDEDLDDDTHEWRPTRREPARAWAWSLERAPIVGSVALVVLATLSAVSMWWLSRPVDGESRMSWVVLVLCSLILHTVARMTWRFTRYGIRIRDGRALVASPDVDATIDLSAIEEIIALPTCLIMKFDEDLYLVATPPSEGSLFACLEVQRWSSILQEGVPDPGVQGPPCAQARFGWLMGILITAPTVCIAVFASGAQLDILKMSDVVNLLRLFG